MPSQFAQKVIDMLSPSIGQFMATRKVTAACDMAKLDIEKIGNGHKKKFSKKLKLVCESLGPNVANSISRNVLSIEK